jgi:hypothetical protein
MGLRTIYCVVAACCCCLPPAACQLGRPGGRCMVVWAGCGAAAAARAGPAARQPPSGSRQPARAAISPTRTRAAAERHQRYRPTWRCKAPATVPRLQAVGSAAHAQTSYLQQPRHSSGHHGRGVVKLCGPAAWSVIDQSPCRPSAAQVLVRRARRQLPRAPRVLKGWQPSEAQRLPPAKAKWQRVRLCSFPPLLPRPL